MALAWMALAGGTAWGQQSSIVWEGEELPAEGGEFYLYNKGGGGFLVGGNDYGTHISIGERGILCTLESDGEGYKVKTYPEQGFYVNPDGWVDNPTAAVFTVADTDADDGENIYSFSKDGGLMSWTQNNGTMVDYSGIDASAEASQWLLVSADQYKRKNEAALGTASENSPVDAHFISMGRTSTVTNRMDGQRTGREETSLRLEGVTTKIPTSRLKHGITTAWTFTNS